MIETFSLLGHRLPPDSLDILWQKQKTDWQLGKPWFCSVRLLGNNCIFFNHEIPLTTEKQATVFPLLVTTKSTVKCCILKLSDKPQFELVALKGSSF